MLAQVLLSAARVAGGGLAVAGLVGDFLLVEWMCGVDVRVSCWGRVAGGGLAVAWRWLAAAMSGRELFI